jgi:ABC-type glycerol-3-phosphate transport system substrate-binding protein
MRFRSITILIVWWAAFVCLLVGCGGINAAMQAVTAEPLATATSIPTETPLPSVVETTPEAPVELSVWLPEPLAPPNNQAAALILESQIENFQAAEPGIQITTRLKQVDGAGGLLATLLSASNVAPAALPDLTLIRRHDLRAVLQSGLAQPLDGRVSSAVLEDFYGTALGLGQLSNRLYGLPYALEIQHIAYQPPQADFAQFSDVLAERRPLVIPAGQVNGLNDVFLVQYVAAGGTIVGGNLGTVNVDALRTVLGFYEQAVAEGVIDPGVLNYPKPGDYQAGLVDGRITAAVVTSGMYLDLLSVGQELETAPIPVSTDTPTTLVDGWIWVLTAKDAERQNTALRFLEWMFEAGRQAAYTRAITMLPSSRAAMRSWGNPGYAAFVGDVLPNAVVPLLDNEGSATARALQTAFVAVISGEMSAEDATEDVVNQLTG